MNNTSSSSMELNELKLGDLAKIKGGKRLPLGKNLTEIPNSHPYIRTRDISNHKIGIDNLLYVPDETFPLIKNYIVEKDDIIVSIVGTIGLCSIVPCELHMASLTENCVKIVDINADKLDRTFLYYYLISPAGQDEIEKRNVGSTQPKLPLYNIKDIPIPNISIREQKVIASILSSLDDKIDLLHRQNKILEEMIAILFRQLFIEEGDGKSVCKITELIEINPKRQLAKGTSASYLEMANVNNTVFHPDAWYKRIFNSGTRFINGDTLLARITPCLENGKVSYVTFLKEGEVGWGSTEFIVLRPKPGLHPLFAYVLCRNNGFKEYAEGCMEGSSGRQRVDVGHLSEYEIYMPSDSHISSFNGIVGAICPKLVSNFNQIQILVKLRDLLLPKLISGGTKLII